MAGNNIGTANGTRQLKHARTVFHTISFCFGLAYGVYSFYVFIYLNGALANANVRNPLDYLLVVLALTMFFEFAAEPMTGRFADRYGRRSSVVLAFIFVAVAFGIYGCVGFTENGLVIGGLATCAELVLAFGLAFHSGALDAWFVDSIAGLPSDEDVNLDAEFGWNMQAFTVGSVLGGVGALLIRHLMNLNNAKNVAPIWPWMLASSLMLVLAFYAMVTMTERRRKVATAEDQEGAKNVLANVVDLWRDKPVRFLLFIMSAAYVSQIAFMFFVPLYLQTASEVSDSDNVKNFSKLIYLLPIALFVPRFLGPMSIKIFCRFMPDPRRRLLYLGLGNSLLFSVAGGAFFLRNELLSFYVSFICLLSAWFFWFANRPVQIALLNKLVKDADNRAFANSMAIPLGAAAMGLIALFLIAAEAVLGHSLVDESAKLTSARSCAALFVFVGVTTAVAIGISCGWLISLGHLAGSANDSED